MAEFPHALAAFKAKRVVEQKSMNQTIEQIKEQALNLACLPTASCTSRGSSPTDYTDDNDEVEYIESTPSLASL